jgi:putative two-component system response regulator
MTSDRPYRPALSQQETIDYIQQQMGRHFDPKVAETFLSIIQTTESEDDLAGISK